MSEHDIRTGMRDAVATEPPLAFDPDELIVKAGKQRRQQRALAGVIAATALVAAGAVSVPTWFGATDQVGAGGQSTTAPPTTVDKTSAPPQTPTKPPLPPEPTEKQLWAPPGARARTLTEAQLRVASTTLGTTAKTKVKALPGVSAVTLIPFAGESSDDIKAGQTYLNGGLPFTFGGKRYVVALSVTVPPAKIPDPQFTCEERPGECQVIDRKDGSFLTVVIDPESSPLSLRLVQVAHYRADGAVVTAVGYNADTFSNGVPEYQPTVPLTVDQLTALATDPAFTF